MCFPELKPQLSTAESFDDVMNVVRERCTIINVACKFENAKLKLHPTSWKLIFSVNFSVCENEDFMRDSSSLLKCETIEFVLEWKINEHTLCEINNLLWKVFGSMDKRVLVKEVKKESSIIVTCFVVDVLRIEV